MQRFFLEKINIAGRKSDGACYFMKLGDSRSAQAAGKRSRQATSSRNDLGDSVGYFHIPDSALAAKAEDCPVGVPPAAASLSHPWRQLLRDMAIGLGRLQTAGDNVKARCPGVPLNRPPLLPDPISNIRCVDQSLPR
jgi:hypothetical protein